ncbi:hypothetical protein VF14_00100 [Nostoc linckia z18]|uniref:DUF2997 domain-containing protein n=2 Tax=Nostoc linckia TaxID=92942 RepID=A0A9Q6EN68_NOSLI|nr:MULTISPECIES: DUF2997 domain-containing protein [Nostoc]PHK43087.1 hypothetical protein VF12_00100 [Nostoc linckia z15]PHK48356.1 hypothetical protein VF13_00095 [Nostoc linckia z16]MCC5670444.1 DUF2997 domain-containing protein [Nostoc mirabile CHAB5784]OYD99725.1 hypothetical protein CDG79_39260 [Nostoc sp. 'Peltigera membranacea cyanobiont' 232]PHJ67265.1 hypothetical protein VF02_05760 [Nostoc linckia z1]
MERAILIHFDTVTGEVKIEAEGFEGLSCLEATQPFEEALGVVEGDRTYKPESQQQLRSIITHQQRLHQ